MKYVLILLLSSMFLFTSSCKKKTKSYNAKGATLLKSGSFVSSAHTTSGTIKLYEKNGVKSLVFEGFKTDKGPDLKVYASTTLTNTNFVSIDVLKSTSGDFFYDLPTELNFDSNKNILIWCEDFSVLFGNATLN